jgi:hypothetical protein
MQTVFGAKAGDAKGASIAVDNEERSFTPMGCS